ncbi:hypothetical protein [Rhizobium leguminosarum]|uniref:hypothetical protein n=1 Tax=Rhizobium leguminosarum TaxID=384 RepID=UPI001C974E52|nr:hypothetical protein [Rhizobium leguminosarum]MBY5827826.1 hypothetical protein [Rhizobium leguminosarum]
MGSSFWQRRRKLLDDFCEHHQVSMDNPTALAAADWLMKARPDDELRFETLIAAIAEGEHPTSDRLGAS